MRKRILNENDKLEIINKLDRYANFDEDVASDKEVDTVIDIVFGDTPIPDKEIATDNEVKDTVDEIFGGESSGSNIATDKEVKDTVDGIFGN